MLEIAVASGKGGTGKTFIASNLILFFEKNDLGGAIGVDADVEAPDLALALGGEEKVILKREVRESVKASVNYDLCDGCLECLKVCNFDAIILEGSKPKIINEFCEGCGACSIICPRKAIMLRETVTGWLSIVETASGVRIVKGDLEIGGRNTGHVVYMARNEAKKLAEEAGKRFIIVDCAPGIGCPVVSSLSGADYLLLVVEPTPQSLQGAKRILEIAKAFKIKSYCILNKYDLNEEFSRKIPEELGLEAIGKIPYDEKVVESYTMMKPIMLSEADGKIKQALDELFEEFIRKIGVKQS